MHTRHRLELIVERMAQARACSILEDAGVTGYTVLSALAGYGNGQRWQRDQDISHARDMVVIISIGDATKIDTALENLHRLLDDHIGVLSVDEVRVLRPDRF